MTKISVLFLITCIFFNCDIQAKSFVGEMEYERAIKQDEFASQEPIFENSKYHTGYGVRDALSKVGPMYDTSNYRTNVMKRSLGEHKPSQRQTGIIYGGGKPIGILQPYQESFKFTPIKEERVYSWNGGRSNIDQPEPYLNLMYPLARFARSEEAIRIAELEAGKAQFLDYHYPSMLVDFKIHNKLHPTGYNSKSIPNLNIKREETSPTNKEMRKKRNYSQNPSTSNQKEHKRENKFVQKRVSSIYKEQPIQTSKQQKRENPLHKREEKSTTLMQKRTGNGYQSLEHKKFKKKRQSRISDSQFENLKNSVSKRNSNGNIQIMEEDLKGLLSDMGLIGDDLEDNAEEMEESKSAIGQEEGFDKTIQKGEEDSLEEQKGDSPVSVERKKRAGRNKLVAPTRIPLSERINPDLKKRTLHHSPNSRSLPEAQETGKRFIELSFSSKDSKEALSGNKNGEDSYPKSSVIPNKREIMNGRSSGDERKRRDNLAESKRSEHASVATTETYEQYEQRVAREIKDKIKQLKEEVKREMGAFESDKDGEDDENSFRESQRKKRFIVNTLMDEETHNIDPNENLENAELEPHVRRRRTLSTDMTSSLDSQNSPLNSYENSQDVNRINIDPLPVVRTKFNGDGSYGKLDSHDLPFANQEWYSNDEIISLHANARRRNPNDLNYFTNDNPGSRNYHRDGSPKYLKTMYNPDYQREIPFSSRGNSRNDLGSKVGSCSSDDKGNASNSNSDEDADAHFDSVVDMTSSSVERKYEERQQLGTNEKHAPIKLQGFNQKNFYYYVGGNKNEKNDNMAEKNQYPFYKTINRNQDKQYDGATENGLTNKRAFQRRSDKSFGRRRKRFVNFMIFPRSREGAIVTNDLSLNSSMPCYPNCRTNAPVGNNVVSSGSKMFREESADGNRRDHWNMTSGLPIKEKGKFQNNSRTNNYAFRPNALIPWNSLMEKCEGKPSKRIGSSCSSQIVEGMQSKNEKPFDSAYIGLFKSRKNSWHGGNLSKSLSNSDFNMNATKQLERKENILRNTQATNKPNKKWKSHNEEDKFSGRKMLSWRVHDNYSQKRPKKEDIQNGRSDHQRGSDEEDYDENYYSDSIATSTFRSFDELVETTPKAEKEEDSTMLSAEKSDEIRTSDIRKEFDGDNESVPSDIITDLGIDNNNVLVPNKILPSRGWKRRKRNVQSEYHQGVRRKRYWLWPTLSSLRNNDPQVEEEETFDQNEPAMFQDRQNSKRSDDKCTASFDDDEEADSEDSASSPGSCETNRRNTGYRSVFPGDKSPNVYTNRGTRSSYMPLSRNRRYVERGLKESPPQLLTEMSDSELFGALPQGYAGELVRYKRVKRNDTGIDV